MNILNHPTDSKFHHANLGNASNVHLVTKTLLSTIFYCFFFFSNRKNCKHNPQCLSGLGEKIWQEDLKINEEEPEDPCNIVRSSGNFVGLTNLGATCYVNSLLQLWFHNPYFRKAVYAWVPLNDPSEVINPTLSKINEGGYNPVSPIGNLQLLFALMQFSKRRYFSKNCIQ